MQWLTTNRGSNPATVGIAGKGIVPGSKRSSVPSVPPEDWRSDSAWVARVGFSGVSESHVRRALDGLRFGQRSLCGPHAARALCRCWHWNDSVVAAVVLVATGVAGEVLNLLVRIGRFVNRSRGNDPALPHRRLRGVDGLAGESKDGACPYMPSAVRGAGRADRRHEVDEPATAIHHRTSRPRCASRAGTRPSLAHTVGCKGHHAISPTTLFAAAESGEAGVAPPAEQ
jgi:hypothetical protein